MNVAWIVVVLILELCRINVVFGEDSDVVPCHESKEECDEQNRQSWRNLGIVFGCIAGVLVALSLCGCCLKSRRDKQQKTPLPEPTQWSEPYTGDAVTARVPTNTPLPPVDGTNTSLERPAYPPGPIPIPSPVVGYSPNYVMMGGGHFYPQPHPGQDWVHQATMPSYESGPAFTPQAPFVSSAPSPMSFQTSFPNPVGYQPFRNPAYHPYPVESSRVPCAPMAPPTSPA